MKNLVKPLQIGKLVLPSNIIYSPLAGCSDFPFRKMSALYRPGLMFCEMVKIDALVRNDQNTLHILDYSADMHPIGGQICGSNVKMAIEAARMVEDLGFDCVDLNCGCPVDKVTKDGSGSGMMKNPQLIGEMLAKIVASVSIPVTVKIRAGWCEKSINAELITQIADQAGCSAVFVHGRTREQGYKGPAVWDHIKRCKQAAKRIKVIGNGDVFDAPAAFRMFTETGCDGVLVSRGTMGHPWLAEDIYRMARGEPAIERTSEMRKEALLEHFEQILRYHHDRRVVLDMRRVGCWYVKSSAGTREFRGLISRAENLDDVRKIVGNFSDMVAMELEDGSKHVEVERDIAPACAC